LVSGSKGEEQAEGFEDRVLKGIVGPKRGEVT
jgi:hypothetical protein